MNSATQDSNGLPDYGLIFVNNDERNRQGVYIDYKYHNDKVIMFFENSNKIIYGNEADSKEVLFALGSNIHYEKSKIIDLNMNMLETIKQFEQKKFETRKLNEDYKAGEIYLIHIFYDEEKNIKDFNEYKIDEKNADSLHNLLVQIENI